MEATGGAERAGHQMKNRGEAAPQSAILSLVSTKATMHLTKSEPLRLALALLLRFVRAQMESPPLGMTATNLAKNASCSTF